ncbi:YcnI family copper-binding membrane protein [Saccharopolyspora sp. 5N708]|uniref:YcnI family copper-binding membrane protein n=1 Tax=Saccharopolyspora sp. 5N708 TaxID=3457424 RepID=UPI003FD5E9CD
MSSAALPSSRKLAIAVGIGVLAALLLSPTASAHVSVTPDTVVAGERSTVSFRVPNERDDASTVRIEVNFPADRPLASATPQAVPGWTVTVHKQQLSTPLSTEHGTLDEAVTSIVWEGGQIAPDTFQEFPVSISSLPHEAGPLVFKSLQTYSDGAVVRWIDTEAAGQPEPEYPAPSLSVVQPQPPAVAESTSDTPARLLGGAGLLAGLTGLGWAALARRKPARARAATAEQEETVRV